MKKLIFSLVIFSGALAGTVVSQVSYAKESKPVYVGGGRYTCNQNTVGCTLIKQNNKRINRENIERGKYRGSERREREKGRVRER